jgi:protein-S-isoprenylcysteine O-methyltransferase Ste14
MFTVEAFIRLDVDRGRIIKVAPALKQGRIGDFVWECVRVYVVELGILYLAFTILKTGSEWGYEGWHERKTGYYGPWFAVMDVFWWIYVYGGLPYVFLTRALQHSPRSDRRQAAFVVMKAGRHLWARVTRSRDEEEEGEARAPLFDRYDKSAMLGLFVKLFYVPLMLVFFGDQFTHLVKNYEWLLGPDFKLANVSMKDVHNVSYTVVFSVDVGLAWCGYAVSSRWIKNTIFSAEPTFLGWSVALLCYPPINQTQGHYYGSPSENAFFSLPSPFAVKVFAIASILSFSVYTSATVMFGLRFSNLTHRGIITTGPYALIRHPAYASKNFSWWCVMLPPVVWEVWTQKNATPLLGVVGMVVMATIYYWRAITEERHLMRDEEYRRYMKKVPYRFIPGVV